MLEFLSTTSWTSLDDSLYIKSKSLIDISVKNIKARVNNPAMTLCIYCSKVEWSLLSRTVLTSLTTLIALFSLYLLGGEVIKGFTLAMIIGVFIGTYSSTFIASQLLLYLGVKRDWSKNNNN